MSPRDSKMPSDNPYSSLFAVTIKHATERELPCHFWYCLQQPQILDLFLSGLTMIVWLKTNSGATVSVCFYLSDEKNAKMSRIFGTRKSRENPSGNAISKREDAYTNYVNNLFHKQFPRQQKCRPDIKRLSQISQRCFRRNYYRMNPPFHYINY